MRALIIASNDKSTRFLAQAENGGHLFFETISPLNLIKGNQVKGEFGEKGRTFFTSSAGIVFEVNVIEYNGALADGLLWLGFIDPNTINFSV